MLRDITQPMTELEAVNVMLNNIGVRAVESFDTEDVTPEAEEAYNVLMTTLQEIQSKGWHFNTERDYTLLPDVNQQIQLPAATLRVDSVRYSKPINVVQRGLRLYNGDRHQYEFEAEDLDVNGELHADLVISLTWDCVPHYIKWYATVKAARRFANNKLATGVAVQLSKIDEDEAQIAAKNGDSINDDASLKVNPHVYDMRRK